MYRGKKILFKTSKKHLNLLFQCNRESAIVWNKCLELSKECMINNGKWINKTQLQANTKGIAAIHSQSIQSVCHKYLESRDSARKLRQNGNLKTRYPYKKKKNFNTVWTDKSFKIYPSGRIELSLGIQNRKRSLPVVVNVKPSQLPSGDIKEIELCYNRGLYLSVTYDDLEMPLKPNGEQSAAIDLGEIHSISSFAESGDSIIITGRKLRAIHRLRNKKLSEIQRKQSKCKKYSKQWKKYQRAKIYILSKSSKQLQDALHKTTSSFVTWCIEQNISDIYIGNPEGVQRKTKKKKHKIVNQKLSNWSFGKLKSYLKYKLESKGKKVYFVGEKYTSQTCPACKKRKKVKGRNYKCNCGYNEHRDIHGARNILSKSIYGDITNIDVKTKIKYLRIA